MAFSAGLYIGIDFIDLVFLDGSRERPRFIKSVRVPIYEDNVPEESRERMAFVVPAIRKALDIAALKIKGINFAMPQDEVIVRRFSMPIIPADERPTAVRFEAQRYLPFKLDETISAFYVASESRTTKTMDAVFVAVNKQAISKYSDLFSDLKITINILDVVPVALLRVLGKGDAFTSDKTKVIIYIEKEMRGSVIIVKERDVYLVREIGASPSKERFLENILNNLRLSIDYFKRETKEVDVNDIIICSDAKISELETFLKENIASAAIEVFSLTNEIEGITELGKRQMAAIGLAMGSFEKPVPKINLALQLSNKIMNFEIIEFKPLLIEAGAIIVSLVVIQLFGSVHLMVAKKKMEEIKKHKMSLLKGVALDASQEELGNLERNVTDRLNFLKSEVGEDRLFLTKKLSLLGSILPEGTWIESLQFSNAVDKERSLLIVGMIYSQNRSGTEIANKIVSDMKASKEFMTGFDDIKLNSVGRTSAYGKDVLSFSIGCSSPVVSSAGVLNSAPRQQQPVPGAANPEVM